MTTAEPAGTPEYFDKSAATWDDDPAKIERAADVARRIRDAVELSRSARLLEYGAGTGLVTQALREQVGPVTLADASSGMRDVLAAKIAAGTLTDARIWDLDLATDPPPDEDFDLIVTVMTLHHIDDLGPVLAGFAQLLDTSGHLCIADLEHEDGSFHGEGFRGHHGFHRPDLAARLEASGFAGVTFADCDPIVRDGGTYPAFLAVCRPAGR